MDLTFPVIGLGWGLRAPAACRLGKPTVPLTCLRTEGRGTAASHGFVSFCATAEDTVSQGTFQHPDGQKVDSKPQVRGRSPAKRQVFQPPAFLATCKLPRRPGTCSPFPGHLISSSFLLHQVPRCGEAVLMLSPSSLCPRGGGWRGNSRALCSFGLTCLFL